MSLKVGEYACIVCKMALLRSQVLVSQVSSSAMLENKGMGAHALKDTPPQTRRGQI